MTTLTVSISCGHCRKSGDHEVVLTPAGTDLEIRSTCLWCGAIGNKRLPFGGELLPLSGAPPDLLVEGIADTASQAGLAESHPGWSKRFRQEGFWMLLGTGIGAIVPARIWLAHEPRLLVLLGMAVVIGLLWLSNRLIKFADLSMPRQGWSLAGILVAARSKGTSARRVSRLAAALTSAATLYAGFMFGAAVAMAVGIHLAPGWHR